MWHISKSGGRRVKQTKIYGPRGNSVHLVILRSLRL